MFGIRLHDKILDLAANTALSFELVNPIYLGDDTEVIQEGFMFTVKVPLTPRNKKALRNPNRLDNATKLMTNEPCEVICQGVPVFAGLLKVRSADDNFAEIYVSVNSLSILKEKRLDDIPIGQFDFQSLGTDTASRKAALAMLMKQTAYDTDNHNYVFCPVHNVSFWEENGTGWQLAPKEFQNKYDGRNKQFELAENVAVTPFLKVDYVWRKIFEYFGFSFLNGWQTTREMKWLLYYNVSSFCNFDGTFISAAYELSQSLPAMKASEALKQLSRDFCFAVFANYFQKTVEFVPYAELITSAPKHDWSRKVQGNMTISENINYPSVFFANRPELSPIPYASLNFLVTYLAYQITFNRPAIYEIADLQNRKITYEWSHEDGPSVVGQRRTDYEFEDRIQSDIKSDITYEKKTQTLPTSLYRINDQTKRGTYCAVSSQKGRIYSLTENPLKQQVLLLYRGVAKYFDSSTQGATPDETPYAAAELETVVRNTTVITKNKVGHDIPNPAPGYAPVDATQTLSMSRKGGIYDEYWREWVEFLMSKRDVKTRILLTLNDVLIFNFKDKVQIENKAYFVKRMRVTLTEYGVAPVEVELVSSVQ